MPIRGTRGHSPVPETLVAPAPCHGGGGAERPRCSPRRWRGRRVSRDAGRDGHVDRARRRHRRGDQGAAGGGHSRPSGWRWSSAIRSWPPSCAGISAGRGSSRATPRACRGCSRRTGVTKVAAVVSGLPLLSLPAEVVTGIVHGVFEALPRGAALVQFTYGPAPPVPRRPAREPASGRRARPAHLAQRAARRGVDVQKARRVTDIPFRRRRCVARITRAPRRLRGAPAQRSRQPAPCRRRGRGDRGRRAGRGGLPADQAHAAAARPWRPVGAARRPRRSRRDHPAHRAARAARGAGRAGLDRRRAGHARRLSDALGLPHRAGRGVAGRRDRDQAQPGEVAAAYRIRCAELFRADSPEIVPSPNPTARSSACRCRSRR